MFRQMYLLFRSTFVLISSLFCVFTTQPRFLSSVQLLVTKNCFINPASTLKILFHQSSFYLSNVICIFLEGKSGGNVRRVMFWTLLSGMCSWSHLANVALRQNHAF